MKVTHQGGRRWIGVPGNHPLEGDEESGGQLSCSQAASENEVDSTYKTLGQNQAKHESASTHVECTCKTQ